jgi:small subunit ribosomal protein S6
MCLLDTNKVAGDVPAAASQILTILNRHQVDVLANRPWDERRLAYPIGKHKKGLYYLIYFSTEGKNLVGIRRDFQLNEMILRSLILKVDPKMVDTMLKVAKDEHALALQMIQEDAADDGSTGGGARPESGPPPRRGGRRHAEGEEK